MSLFIDGQVIKGVMEIENPGVLYFHFPDMVFQTCGLLPDGANPERVKAGEEGREVGYRFVKREGNHFYYERV